jgi:hypothetical protein
VQGEAGVDYQIVLIGTSIPPSISPP